MSNSRLVSYVVKYTFVQAVTSTPSEWKVRVQGRPTAANLAKDVSHFEASCQPGGCNAHLGALTVRAAVILDQRIGATVATFAK